MLDFLAPGGGAYEVIKGLHIAAVIFWMAGMLYLPRLFVYHHTAARGGELETALLKQQHNLLKIIMNPALVAVWLLAIIMLAANPALLSQGWMHAKLVLVLALSGVHGFYAASARKFANAQRPRTEKFWRIMNEVPAIGALIIAVIAVWKPF
ncbi:CopD family protein [Alkalicaulis satelles]|uniref:Protoporphyrinogen IX oxidase n=1 Tax=Alkalicaulis satelles TaxID=2609175 RepID=A0A5M6ZJA2_9PROT|nr:CopD family protein [Alkalicaulis satelles]KAA5803824.1 CopD family protein [Alkalicaulis satelles]